MPFLELETIKKIYELLEGKSGREKCASSKGWSALIYGGKSIGKTHRSSGNIPGSAFLVTSPVPCIVKAAELLAYYRLSGEFRALDHREQALKPGQW
jgi:hypothetical protein